MDTFLTWRKKSVMEKDLWQMIDEANTQNYGDNSVVLWKEAREQIKQIYTGIQEMPDKVKVAVRNKAYGIVDQAVQKTAFVFDKGIQYLQVKKKF